MAEFIKYAKANGDKINLANAGPGAVSQLCGSLLQQALGVKFYGVTTLNHIAKLPDAHPESRGSERQLIHIPANIRCRPRKPAFML